MGQRKADELRNTLIALGIIALIIVVSLILIARPGVILPMSEASYGSSLSGVMDGSGGECSPTREEGKLVCGVETGYSGTSGTIVLRKGSRGCWTARQTRGDNPPISGCVSMLDLLNPDEPGLNY